MHGTAPFARWHLQKMLVAVLPVKVPQARLHRQLRVARPAVLFAMRTVRGDADEIGEVAALGGGLQGCE